MGGMMAIKSSRFNPTLVRLRLFLGPTRVRRNILFQSHAGSIEADLARANLPTEPLFQSHAGSIEAHGERFEFTNNLPVSIPRWFD